MLRAEKDLAMVVQKMELSEATSHRWRQPSGGTDLVSECRMVSPTDVVWCGDSRSENRLRPVVGQTRDTQIFVHPAKIF